MNRNYPNPSYKYALIVVLIVTAFTAGLLMGNSGVLHNKQVGSVGDLPFDLNYLTNIYSKVNTDYLGSTPNSETLTQSLAKGLIESLNDPYSAYLNPKEATEYLKMADSAFGGIGVQLGYNEQYTIVESVLEGFPGAQAGLKNGDVILTVDGEDMSSKRPEIVASKVKGLEGTTVKLQIFRQSEGKTRDFAIVRAEIKLDNITFTELADGNVLIRIVKFTDGARNGKNGVQVFNSNWASIVGRVSALNPKGIIVDLRNNPGGYVDSVRYVAEEFLKDGQIIMKEKQNGQEETVYVDERTGKFETTPMVVLVNEGSASASEIFAGAMHDNNRAKVIGEKTVGKGVEQELLPLEDNSLLLLVFRKWLTPNNRQIDKLNPITPDEIVKYEEPKTAGGNDSQVSRALEIISGQK